MSADLIGYMDMIEAAHRGLVRDVLAKVAERGLLGAHHLYITFDTKADGVEMPEWLREQYPEEITIVLQHQYWGLEANADHFTVTLTFRKVPATLVVPYAALRQFADPSTRFGLQFRGGPQAAAEPETPAPPAAKAKKPKAAKPAPPKADTPPAPAPDAGGSGSVVSLDQFRKK